MNVSEKGEISKPSFSIRWHYQPPYTLLFLSSKEVVLQQYSLGLALGFRFFDQKGSNENLISKQF